MSGKIRIGPYCPSEDEAVVYCMVGDEPLMFQPKELLNTKQLTHLDMMRHGILPYAMAMIPISQKEDTVVLDSEFLKQHEYFNAHLACYSLAKINFTNKINFSSTDSLYHSAIELAKNDQMICCVCFSYELNQFTDIGELLEVSQKVNSKLHLAANSKSMNYQVPPSDIVSKEDILLTGEALVKKYPFEILCKNDGLGGGFNVNEIKRANDFLTVIKDYKPLDKFVIQKKLDKSLYNEYAIDFIIKDSRHYLHNIRKILTQDNQWFGNVFEPDIKMNATQKKNIDNCLNFLRESGYYSKEGYICSLDVLQNDKEQYILEVNARWSGGFPVAKFLKKIKYKSKSSVTAYIDYIDAKDFNKYIDYVKENLFMADEAEQLSAKFKLFPMGFCPVIAEEKVCVWICVFGDFNAFVKDVQLKFNVASFSMAKGLIRV